MLRTLLATLRMMWAVEAGVRERERQVYLRKQAVREGNELVESYEEMEDSIDDEVLLLVILSKGP